MAVQFVTLPSGTTASSAFVLDRASERLGVQVASLAQNAFSIEFATTTAGPFAPLTRDDGSGLTFLVASTATGAWGSARALSVVGRIRAASAPSATTSIAIFPLSVP
jgi:hypothetical protein